MADLQLSRILKKIEMKQCVILQCFTLLNHATTCTGVSFKGLQNTELPFHSEEGIPTTEILSTNAI